MRKKRFCPSTRLYNLSKSQFAYFYGNSRNSSYSFHTIKKNLDLPFLTSEMSCRIRGFVYLSCVELSAPASLFSNIREVLQGPCSSCRQHIKRFPHKIFLLLDAWWECSDCYWHLLALSCKVQMMSPQLLPVTADWIVLVLNITLCRARKLSFSIQVM